MEVNDSSVSGPIPSILFGTVFLIGAGLVWRYIPGHLSRTKSWMDRFLLRRQFHEPPQWYLRMMQVVMSGLIGLFGIILLLSALFDIAV